MLIVDDDLEMFEEDVHRDESPVYGVRPGDVDAVSDVPGVAHSHVVDGEVGQAQLHHVLGSQVAAIMARMRGHGLPQPLNHILLAHIRLLLRRPKTIIIY